MERRVLKEAHRRMSKFLSPRHRNLVRTAFLAIAVVVAMGTGIALATLARAEQPTGQTPAAPSPDSR
jgi:hypothetical protein